MTHGLAARLDGDTLVVRIPMRFQRRGGRKRIVAAGWERDRNGGKAVARLHARQGAHPCLALAAAARRGRL